MLDLTLSEKLVTNNIWDAAQQELDMLFNTMNCELIGYPDYGTNFEQFLWSLTPMTSELRRYVENKVNNLSFVNALRYNIEIQNIMNEATHENQYHVKITLYDDESYVEKIYNLNNLE